MVKKKKLGGLHSVFFFHQPNHQIFIGLGRDDLFLPFRHLDRATGAETGADPTSNAERLIDDWVISCHLDGFNLTMIHTHFATIALFLVQAGQVTGSCHSMLQLMEGDPLEESATAPATVTDEGGLIQYVISDVHQSMIFCFLQNAQQFVRGGPFRKSLFHHKVRGIPQSHADIINGRRAILPQMPCLMPAIAFGHTAPSSHFDMLGRLIKSENFTPDLWKIPAVDVGPAPARPGGEKLLDKFGCVFISMHQLG